jgi:demethylmenaquinone methyltransferase/2-methoxy-6-polyprenyl-1,4-benzoquinol methylase
VKRTAWSAAATAAAVGAGVWIGSRSSGIKDRDDVRVLYDRVAGLYDAWVAPYEIIGARRLQRRAIAELRLSPGDTVVDLGTGTGWNLSLLADAVGPTGQVVGVDLSSEMLERARRRAGGAGRQNLSLVQADLRDFDLPASTAAVIAAFAMEMVPEHDHVVARLAAQAKPRARIALVGLREPPGWPEWAVRLGAMLNRPFGVDAAYRAITPWTSIGRHLTDAIHETALAGAVYLAAGTVGPRSRTDVHDDQQSPSP